MTELETRSSCSAYATGVMLCAKNLITGNDYDWPQGIRDRCVRGYKYILRFYSFIFTTECGRSLIWGSANYGLKAHHQVFWVFFLFLYFISLFERDIEH